MVDTCWKAWTPGPHPGAAAVFPNCPLSLDRAELGLAGAPILLKSLACNMVLSRGGPLRTVLPLHPPSGSLGWA